MERPAARWLARTARSESRRMSEWRPSCMSEDEYVYWYLGALRAHRLANLGVPLICADCPPAFRLAAGATCNTIATPENPRRARLLALRAEGLTWAQVAAREGLTWRQAYDRARKPAGRVA